MKGNVIATDYEDDVARDPRVDALRNKMVCVEKKEWTRDYLDPARRSIANAVQVFFKKNLRSTRRILKHHREVELPVWQIPFALAIAWTYYSTLAGTQMVSALLGGLPDALRVRWVESA